MNHIPKSLHIGEETYKVVFKKFKDKTMRGLCDPEKKEISLAKGMSKRNTIKTLFHEVLHGIEEEHGIKLKHKTIYQLEEAFFQLYLDNFK